MSTEEEMDKSYSEPIPREEIIQTAIKFLQNPKVISTALAQKQKFLQRKGLTDKEIQIACERSGAYQHENERQANVPPLPRPYYPQPQTQLTIFDRVREVVHSSALFGLVIYAVYKFYVKFIKPFLFGKKKSVEETLADLDKKLDESITDIKDNLTSVKIEVDRISRTGSGDTQRQLQNLQNDINSVKGILLSRKQFPTVANVPSSIPAWQMAAAGNDQDPDVDHENKNDDIMEIGSGSGSSDPEHATKTSDSSLEIIS